MQTMDPDGRGLPGAGGAARLGALGAILAAPLVGVVLVRATWAHALDVADEIVHAPSPALTTVSLGELLAIAAGAVGAGAAAHLSVMTLLLVATPRRSRARRAAARLTPAGWRTMIGVATAGLLSAGVAGPALASPSASDAGWVPEPISQPAEPATSPVTPSPEPDASGSEASGSSTERPYVVATGDSLWTIAADALDGQLGDGRSTGDVAAIAQAWPELYEANRDVVGADPSLIRPGDQLVMPEEWSR